MSLLMMGGMRVVAGASVFNPTDGILLTTSRQGSTGSVLVGSGVLLPEGEATDDSTMSLWTVDGTEVSFGAIPLDFTHTDGSIMGVYIHRTADIPDGTQYYLRTATASTVTRETTVTPPRVPASYFVAPPAHQCAALPHPFKLPTWEETQAVPDQADWATEYKEWIEQDDAAYSDYNVYLMHGGLRNALYGRAHQSMCMGLMRGEAYWFKHAHSLMAGGSSAGQQWLNSLATGNIGAIGNEWALDMIECFLTYLISGCTDYLLALDTGAKQLHDVARLADPAPDGTLYNLRSGWERSLGRAFQAYQLVANAGRTVTAGDYGYGANSRTINLAQLPARADKVLDRVVMPSGIAWDLSYFSRGDIDVDTDTTKVRLEALEQRDTVANGSVNITIGAQTITIPSGATMTDTGQRRAVAVLLSWDGSTVVATPGTVQNGVAYNTDSQPWRSWLPALPGGNREIGHVVIFAEAGTVYTANTTALPAHKGTLSGITAWYFAHTRNAGYKPYMTGIALNAAMQFVDWYPSDPSASAMQDRIEAICEDVWTYWNAVEQQFPYVTVDSQENGIVVYASGGGTTPSISYRSYNTLMGQAFAWLGWKLNSTTWRDRAKTVTDGSYSLAFSTAAGWSSPGRFPTADNTVNHKSGDEAHAFLFHSFYYRNQVA